MSPGTVLLSSTSDTDLLAARAAAWEDGLAAPRVSGAPTVLLGGEAVHGAELTRTTYLDVEEDLEGDE
ncbi:hypothetical protein ACWD26_06420 [Streptomyces sp. NPDC002787]